MHNGLTAAPLPQVSEKTATPTSVVLMAINTVVGFLYRNYGQGGVEREAWSILLVCAPIVCFGAPLGSFIGSFVHRLVPFSPSSSNHEPTPFATPPAKAAGRVGERAATYLSWPSLWRVAPHSYGLPTSRSPHYHTHDASFRTAQVLAWAIYLTDSVQLIAAIIIVKPWLSLPTPPGHDTPVHLTASSAAIFVSGLVFFYILQVRAYHERPT